MFLKLAAAVGLTLRPRSFAAIGSNKLDKKIGVIPWVVKLCEFATAYLAPCWYLALMNSEGGSHRYSCWLPA